MQQKKKWIENDCNFFPCNFFVREQRALCILGRYSYPQQTYIWALGIFCMAAQMDAVISSVEVFYCLRIWPLPNTHTHTQKRMLSLSINQCQKLPDSSRTSSKSSKATNSLSLGAKWLINASKIQWCSLHSRWSPFSCNTPGGQRNTGQNYYSVLSRPQGQIGYKG